jgi:hypothetical protein
MARVPVALNQALAPGQVVDGLLRIFDNGVELPESPIYSTNGPLVLPLTPTPTVLDDSLNFIFIAPDSTNITLTVEVNPAGPSQLPEADFSNNSLSVPASFVCKRVPEVIYIPIDYRPSGGSIPNLPDPALYEPGVGDNFIQGIYPAADWDYRPAPVPSKLWTQSLSGTGSALLNSLDVDFQMLNPKPDFIFGWVPGSLPYNGQASGIPGNVGIGNTQTIRHQRTFAHELGHLFGLSHNTKNIDAVGIDVEHHLAITESLPVVKDQGKKDIMAAGLLTNQAWVWGSNYTYFLNHPKYQCAAAKAGPSAEERLLVAGLLDRATDTVQLTDVVTFDGTTPTFPEAGVDLWVTAYAQGREVGQVGVSANNDVDCSESGALLPIAGFVAVVPSSVPADQIERLVVTDARTGALRGELLQSASAPTAAFASVAVSGKDLRASWSASDAEGDALRFYVRYSPDGQRTVPVATGTTATDLSLDLSRVQAPGTGAWLELMATDGLRTTRVRHDLSPAALDAKLLTGAAPTTYVLTPDTNSTFQRGATVVLHSSGWDLEDRSLTGTSISWSSDKDGFLANGRVTSVADLSLGTHVITVTATDSRGQTATDTTTVTVTDRPLPGSVVVCQADLGSGGPGSSLLEVCGGDLSTGTTADVLLSGAAPGQPLWLLVGASSNPTALFGGTLLPVPTLALIPGSTDASGDWTLSGVPGGMGPASLFTQAVYLDAAQGQGFGISNAVRIDLLP